ncbi:MAG: glycerate kinase [Bacteroidales bacterium]|nr:glycerate kinase [Bacteroidales bacterium]
MRKIVIASDSFKGSLPAAEVSDALAHGIKSVDRDCEICTIPVSDGGEGLAECLVRALDGKMIHCMVNGPLGRPVEAGWGLVADKNGRRTAVVDMASAAGLSLLAAEERNPLKTSTYGAGQLLLDALERGCRDIILGIGGSATNDCAMGMLRALGVRFLDAGGKELKGTGEDLVELRSIDASSLNPAVREVSVRVACDVSNPLYGPQGAACVYAPQKGASPEDVRALDEGLRNFAKVAEDFCGEDVSSFPGAGAAGGMGAGLKALLGAEMFPGIELMLSMLGFDVLLQDCDLVITGEGRMDVQTLMGKAPAGVLKAASAKGIPAIAIVGAADLSEDLLSGGFAGIFPVSGKELSIEEAMRPEVTRRNLNRTAARIAERLQGKSGEELSDALRMLAGNDQF